MAGLSDLTPWYESSQLPDEVAKKAMEVIPGFERQGDVAPKYREHLLSAYQGRDGYPPRTADNGERRTVNETRLDRAWNDVAERFDRSEQDIRTCVLGVYDGSGEYGTKTERLREDFNTILAEAEGSGD